MVMWQRATGAVVPATTQEACALRRDEAAGRECGKDGSSIALLRQGAKRRWDRDTPTQLAGWPALRNALVPGTAAVVFGSMGAFSAGSHWRRHDPGFAGKHATEVERRDDTDRVWWDDPLAAPGVYNGEWMPLADLERFVRAWPGARHLVAAMIGGSVGPDIDLSDNLVYGRGVKVKVGGAKIVDEAGKALGTAAAETVLPYIGTTPTMRVVAWHDAPGYIAWADGDIVVIAPPPAPAGEYERGRRDEYDAVLAGLGIPPRP